MNNDLNKIESIFGKIKKIDASYEVRASAKYYPHHTKVFIPNVPYRKMIPFMEQRIDDLDDIVEDWDTRVIADSKTSTEDNLERSIRRTKTLISDYVLCNDFDIFATFTFSPKKTADRTDTRTVKRQMSNWIKNQKARNSNFAYLIVPEFHKDGKSLHFHALIHDYPGELIDSGNRINGRKSYNFKSYTLGINSAVKIDDRHKVSNYVKKYITKDMPQFPGKHRFWSSTGLERPRVEDNPSEWYLQAKPQRVYENEYGCTLYFITDSSQATESHSLTEGSTPPSLSEKDA